MAKESFRKCSHCGHNGHNSRTCNNKGIKLFGVKINVGEDDFAKKQDESLRKCKSMGNLEACNHEKINDADADGYLSDGLIHGSSKAKTAHERRKGKPWSQEEHRSFLFGLEKLGKGDWKGISKNFVQSRTPTQVASHAQKYYLRMTAIEKKKRRSSVFDIPLNEMDSNSQISPISTSPSGTNSPQGSLTSPVKTCERPPLSPKATMHVVSDLFRPRFMLGACNLPTCTAMPNVSILPMWSFSNKNFASLPDITAKYTSMAQQSGGISSLLSSYVTPRVAPANESANKDCH